MRLTELTDRYFTWARPLRRPNTLDQLQRYWARFLSYTAATCVSEITRAEVEAYRAVLIAQGLSCRTINIALIACTTIINAAIENEWYSGPNPFARTRRMRVRDRAPRWLTEAQRDRLLSVATGHSTDMLLFCALGVFAGLRKAECIAARWEWLAWDAGCLVVGQSADWHTKSHRDRAVPLPAGRRAMRVRPPGRLRAVSTNRPPRVTRSVSLTRDDWRALSEIGDGNCSHAVRSLIRWHQAGALPVPLPARPPETPREPGLPHTPLAAEGEHNA